MLEAKFNSQDEGRLAVRQGLAVRGLKMTFFAVGEDSHLKQDDDGKHDCKWQKLRAARTAPTDLLTGRERESSGSGCGAPRLPKTSHSQRFILEFNNNKPSNNNWTS